MTLETFEIAKDLLKRRASLLEAYEKVNMWINNINQPVWYGIKIASTQSIVRDIPISPNMEEIKNLLFSMRDRYDAEIAKIDKEIAAL